MEEKVEALKKVVSDLGTKKFEVPEIGVDEVIKRLEENDSTLVLLDARSQEERDVSTIQGSITKEAFLADPKAFENKDVVCYCTVGYISGGTTCELRRAGHNNVKNFGDGALLAYTLNMTNKGVKNPLVKLNGTPTNEVHTFMPDLAPLAGEGMVGKSFADPGAVLTKANEHIKNTLGL